MTISLFFGENDFVKRQQINNFIQKSTGKVEKFDASCLTLDKLENILYNVNLFNDQEIIWLDGLEENPLYSEIEKILSPSQKPIILSCYKIDKRTASYKWLKKVAKIYEFNNLSQSQHHQMKQWLNERADYYSFKLDNSLAEQLIERVGYDQLRLDQFLQQFSLVDNLDQATFDFLVPLAENETIFNLFIDVLRGDRPKINQTINFLMTHEGNDGAYKAFGFIVSSVVALNALVLSPNHDQISRDMPFIKPFFINKLKPFSHKFKKPHIAKINQILADADLKMKTSSLSPWLVLEVALLKISYIAKLK